MLIDNTKFLSDTVPAPKVCPACHFLAVFCHSNRLDRTVIFTAAIYAHKTLLF